MGRVDKTSTSAKTDQAQFRTPIRRADPSVSSNRTPATKTNLIETPVSSSSTSRSLKKGLLRNVEDQPTLTQIDFVTVSQNPESDDDLEYIGGPPENIPEVIEIDDDPDDDIDYRPPSTSRTDRVRGVKFEQGAKNHLLSRQKKLGQIEAENRKGRRKSGDSMRVNKTEKGIDKKDKTLTQMDYVRRYVKMPDEDANFEYTYITPKKKDPESKTPHYSTMAKIEDVQLPKDPMSETSKNLKKRKASVDSDQKETVSGVQPGEEKRTSELPVTPKKTMRSEIPSSQSPESPGLEFITSSQFRSATRSPQKRFSPTKRFSQHITRPYVKEESPGLEKSRKPGEYSSNHINNGTHSKDPKPNDRSSSAPRVVVYETDAESDYGDFQGDSPILSRSPHDQEALRPCDDDGNDDHDDDHVDSNSLNPDSQELPPVPLFRQDGEGVSESNLMSDASICYQRVQQATQFPLEPIPRINTQKMAELFPEDSNGLDTMTTASMSSPSIKGRLALDPNFETQSQTQTQTPSQGIDKAPAEVVPESSPVTRRGIGTEFRSRVPSAPHVVVQVESSQPADRLHKQAPMGQDSGPRGILSRSQILTSSVMESIPLPAFWMSSQDSVGEPYSLPET